MRVMVIMKQRLIMTVGLTMTVGLIMEQRLIMTVGLIMVRRLIMKVTGTAALRGRPIRTRPSHPPTPFRCRSARAVSR
ncbi:hypothetical protein ACQBAU_05025 [Propionibacteriaceae bacterium Y2011]